MKKKRIFIGTSGWVYSHWEGIFYPKDLKDLRQKDKLKYFSRYFKTAEINYSFYHLPKPTVYQNWHSQTPADFLFAVKASRFITHIKRLKNIKQPWRVFLKNALNLKDKLGPILFQFPASFKATEENIKRLEAFLEELDEVRPPPLRPRGGGRISTKLRFAFEFRHQSWRNEKIYSLLKKYNACWVIADSPIYPRVDKLTADFVYIRLHGSRNLFSSKYTDEELEILAQRIKKWRRDKDVFVYFNNDARGYAIENAKTLAGILK